MAIAVASQSKTILIAGDPVRVEADAAATIPPGSCVKRDAAGDYVLSGASENLQNIALEQDFKGSDGVDFAINIDYVSGDRVLAAAPRKGDRYQFTLDAGAGAVAIGAELGIAAGGDVTDVTVTNPVAVALEAATGGTDTHIVAEVL